MLENIRKNKILYRLGFLHLVIFIALCVFSIFNNTTILGINAMYKPIKFALSIWVYSWTMAILLQFVNHQKKVIVYSWVAMGCMVFEQSAITLQAFKGEPSHFNIRNTFGIILFTAMGIVILTITLWTAYITYILILQRNSTHPKALLLGVKIGLIYFIIFSLFGGYISSLPGHTVGAQDGGSGLWFINWSTVFGDLRVAHFFGIHSLQILPIIAYFASSYFTDRKAIIIVSNFAILYFLFVMGTMIQGLFGLPFIR